MREIPRVLWSYWSSGSPPPVVQHCLRSWSVQAADWDVRFLNRTSVHAWLIDGIDFPPGTWARSPQHQSDMVGLALLRRFGGVWVDASVLMTKPLRWIGNEIRKQSGNIDFLGYESNTGSPEIFFYASVARGAMAYHWWAELYALWERCPDLHTAGCVRRYNMHTTGQGAAAPSPNLQEAS